MATKKKQLRHFTPEYKSEVVQLVQTGGKTAGQVARDADTRSPRLRVSSRRR
jgi:transposase-like protein